MSQRPPRLTDGLLTIAIVPALIGWLWGLASIRPAGPLAPDVAPAGALFVTAALLLLHGLSVVPLAFALAALGRRLLAASPRSAAAVIGVIGLVATAIAFRPSTVALAIAVAPGPLPGSVVARSLVALVVLLPAAWLVLIGSEARLGLTVATLTRGAAAAWLGLGVVVAGLMPPVLYPAHLVAWSERAGGALADGFPAKARRELLAIRAAAGDATIDRLGDGPRLADVDAMLARAANTVAAPRRPGDATARGGALLALDRPAEAEVELQAALAARAKDGGALHGLGSVAWSRGDWPAAFAYFAREAALARELLVEDPASAQVRAVLNRALMWQARAAIAERRMRVALPLLDQALAAHETANVHMMASGVASALGRGRIALHHRERAAELTAEPAEARDRSHRKLLEESFDCALIDRH